MNAVGDRARRTGPRALDVTVTRRYRAMWGVVRLLIRLLFDVRVTGAERWPAAPFQIVANHHNGFDPLIVIGALPLEPRITWFGPREADFSHGFKNRLMAFFGGVIPYSPDGTTLTSAVRAVRRVFDAGGVLAIFAEGRIGFRETGLLPFEDGAAAFAVAAGVPVVPCAIVGTTQLWFRRRVDVRFGEPIATTGIRGRAGRIELDGRIRSAIETMLPRAEPHVPRRRPLSFLTDVLNGPDDIARRNASERA